MSNPLKLVALHWAYPSVHGIRVQIPWDENRPQYGKYHYAFSKGTRRQIVAFTEGACPHREKWAIQNWMKGQNDQEIHVGIDCNGFVYRVLDEAAQISGVPTLTDTLGTACEYTDLDTLTPLNQPILRAADVRAGDTMRFNKGRHSGVVFETVTDPTGRLTEIWYAHSSFTRGPHIGWVEVADPFAPIQAKVQTWHDEMWDGLTNNNLRDLYFTSIHQSWFYRGPRPRVVKRGGIKIQVNGAAVEFAVAPFVLDGHTLAQVRPLAEAMGATITWTQASQTVTLTAGARTAQCQVGSEVGVTDGRGVLLQQPPTLIGDNLVLPVRFVAEALGYQVGWENATGVVSLNRLLA